MLEQALVKPLVWLYYLLSPLWFTKGLQLHSIYAAAPQLAELLKSANLSFYTLHWDQTWPWNLSRHKSIYYEFIQDGMTEAVCLPPLLLTHYWASQFDDVPQIMSRQNCEIKWWKWCFLTIRKHSIGLSFYDVLVVWLKFGSKPHAYSGCCLILGEEMNKI